MRSIYKRYVREILMALTAYMIIMLTVWPLLDTTDSLGLRVGIALSPVIPILFGIRSLVRYILDADELIQRLHLEALAISAGTVAVVCILVGFLVEAKLIELDGSILFWVFPALGGTFGLARGLAARRYARA